MRRRLGSAALALALAAPAALAAPPPFGPGPRARAAHLAAELEAARSHDLYLVLDPWTRRLDLKADGLLLRRFQAERALYGRPRIARGEARWEAPSYALVSEIREPDRPKVPIGAARDAASTEAERKRDALLAQAPTHFRLRFEPALDLSIRGEAGVDVGPNRLRHWLLEGWENAARTVFLRPNPPRVVLTLRPEEAQRLFLALQPEMRLLVKAP